MNLRNLRYAAAILSSFAFLILTANPAYALPWGSLFGTTSNGDISTVAENIVTSIEGLPGLLTAIAYLLGLLFAVLAIFKLKDHVENPTQIPLRSSMARFLIGGALFALPMIFEAMESAFNGGNDYVFSPDTFGVANIFSSASGILGGALGSIGIQQDINFLLASIIASVRNVPALITAVGYLLGMVFAIIGLLKIKDHIENPEQTNLKEGVIRLLVGGALFALPTIYEAMKITVTGGGGGISIGSIIGAIGELNGLFGAGACDPLSTLLGGLGGLLGGLLGGGGSSPPTLGNTMCALVAHTSAFQAFLTSISYLFGTVLGAWGILKIQDHVLNPSQTPIWEGISRFLAAGCFFAFPFVTAVIKNTIAPTSLVQSFFDFTSLISGLLGFLGGLFGGGGSAPICNGLDGAVNCFMLDIFLPMQVIISTFTLFAGMVLIMIGISRLIKSSQDGARAPGGLGTMMTFVTGGALVSYNNMLGAVSGSMFNQGLSGNGGLSYGSLVYTTGMSSDEIAHAELLIGSITKFMVLVGMISFARGIFIIRNVAEGNGQASLMAGFTHVIGGAMAVNLGPLLNAVQASLGIAGYGITFS